MMIMVILSVVLVLLMYLKEMVKIGNIKRNLLRVIKE